MSRELELLSIHWLRICSRISSSAQLILMHDSHVSTSLNLIMLLLSTTHVFVTMALMGYLLGSMLTSRTLLFLFLFIVCGLYLTAQMKHLLASIMFISWVCLRNLALRLVTEFVHTGLVILDHCPHVDASSRILTDCGTFATRNVVSERQAHASKHR